MVIASPRFEEARRLSEAGELVYTVIEEISWESRHDKINGEKIKKEAVDNTTIEYIKVLKVITSKLIQAGVLKVNEGSGDIMLVVEYLVSGKGEQTDLFEEQFTPIIVTNDKNLTSYCLAEKVNTITDEEFLELCSKLN